MVINSGSISIHAQNIMPIIKKWLYSDKDIFIREMVSNACDAITKHRMLANRGEAGAAAEYEVHVVVDEEQKALRFIDNGIGMTAEEVEKYINQVAFSGAEEFLEKYKEQGDAAQIIGHFGLGFYSAFMVSKRVEINTRSYIGDAVPVRWVSEDGMTFELDEGDREGHGTTITLYLMDDETEFLESYKVRQTLEKYCGFMSVPIYLDVVKPEAEKADHEDGHDHEHDHHDHDHHDHEHHDHDDEPDDFDEESKKPTPVNDLNPLWLKTPGEVTDEEYKAFYRKNFTDFDDPLFWVHLNVDYPFNVKGILYFPKLKNDFGGNEGQVKLYCGQVFVADNIKEVIPEFLLLLKGVVDCPDLPLNVSRSFLQNDGYVRKLSAHITKKVGDRLNALYRDDRSHYIEYWKDIHPFVKYGCIRDAKFYEQVKDIVLYPLTKTGEPEGSETEGSETKGSETKGSNMLSLKELRERNETIYYATDPKRQEATVALYERQGIDVAVMDSVIDSNFISFLEYTEKDLKFMRIDAGADALSEGQAEESERESLEKLFRKALGNSNLKLKLESLKDDTLPALMITSEQSRRFAEMSRMYGQPGFAMPEDKTLLVNRKNPLTDWLLDKYNKEIMPLESEEDGARELPKDVTAVCEQIGDLAEMQTGPLEPERMNTFIARSIDILVLLSKAAE